MKKMDKRFVRATTPEEDPRAVSAQVSEMNRRARFPDTRYPIPNTRYPIPNTRYPIPQYPIPDTQYPVVPRGSL